MLFATKSAVENDHANFLSAASPCGAGAAVWDAAVVLAVYLPTLAVTSGGASATAGAAAAAAAAGGWQGQRMLELGCGAGLLAIAAARLGAVVTATDCDERVLALCAENAAANGVSSRVITGRLAWGEDTAAIEQLQVLNDGGGGGGWDVVLVADCLYQREATRPLLATLTAACAQRRGDAAPTTVLVGYKTRMAAQLVFFRLAARQGWEINWVPQVGPIKQHAYEACHCQPISLQQQQVD